MHTHIHTHTHTHTQAHTVWIFQLIEFSCINTRFYFYWSTFLLLILFLACISSVSWKWHFIFVSYISRSKTNIIVYVRYRFAAAAAAKSLQSCLTRDDPIDSNPPGSPVPGILQARTLEWVAISFSSAWKRKVKVKSLSRVQLLATPWTAAHQAPPSMGFSRQEYWSELPLPSLRYRFRQYIFKTMIKQKSVVGDVY